MKNLFKIAIRNLLRNRRRTNLTVMIISIGMIMVIVLSGVTSSFKTLMIGTITDTMLGHLQIHKKGYVNSIDIMPLNITLTKDEMSAISEILKKNKAVSSFSYRIKLGGVVSNFTQTSNVKINAIYPEMETKTCPGLQKKVTGDFTDPSMIIKPGGIIIPDNIKNGLSLNLGDPIVVIANNKYGSVNGLNLVVSGFLEKQGAIGNDAYLHIDDVETLLRMEEIEITEIVIRTKNLERLPKIYDNIKMQLSKIPGTNLEIHTWDQLAPFATIAKIINLFIIIVKLILILIVSVSILNVMIMSVYERIREIGTIAAMGTQPRKILSLFLLEGLCLGFFGSLVGNIIGLAILFILNLIKLHFPFGRIEVTLAPTISPPELIAVFIIVMIVSIIASFRPAFLAYKLEPVDALRHV